MTSKQRPSPLPTATVHRLPKRLTEPRAVTASSPRRAPAALLGAQIRAIRVAAQTSGGELAACAGVSRSMLSRVERGLASPSVETLERLAAGLGVSISRFFAEHTDRADFLHAPAGRGIPVGHHDVLADCRCELLGQLRAGDMKVAPCLMHLDAPHQLPGTMQHEGLKFVYVLSGNVRYRYGAKEVQVAPGDALMFNASVDHGIVSTQEAAVRILCVSFSLRA